MKEEGRLGEKRRVGMGNKNKKNYKSGNRKKNRKINRKRVKGRDMIWKKEKGEGKGREDRKISRFLLFNNYNFFSL